MLHVVSIICVLRIENPLMDIVCDTAWLGELYTAGPLIFFFFFFRLKRTNRGNRIRRRD